MLVRDMNNKLIAFLILSVACFAGAQSVLSIGKSAPREHRGFYNSTSFGFAYNWYNSSRDDVDEYDNGNRKNHDIDYYEYNGFSFALAEFKFGVALANLVAFHTVFNIGFYTGAMDYFNEEYNTNCIDEICVDVPDPDVKEPTSGDGYSFRTFLGFGATFYPIQDKNSPMNGLFVGGSFGYTLFLTMMNGGHSDATGNGGVGFELEIGKEWWINDHYSIGVGIGFAHNGLIWETVKSHKSDNVISLSFRMTRG